MLINICQYNMDALLQNMQSVIKHLQDGTCTSICLARPGVVYEFWKLLQDSISLEKRPTNILLTIYFQLNLNPNNIVCVISPRDTTYTPWPLWAYTSVLCKKKHHTVSTNVPSK